MKNELTSLCIRIWEQIPKCKPSDANIVDSEIVWNGNPSEMQKRDSIQASCLRCLLWYCGEFNSIEFQQLKIIYKIQSKDLYNNCLWSVHPIQTADDLTGSMLIAVEECYNFFKNNKKQ